MKLPSSSSLLLASLAISSSSSSLSALAAPTSDCPEDSSSPSTAPVPSGSDDPMTQPNNHLQSRGLLPDDLKKTLLNIIGALDVPEARQVPLDVPKLPIPGLKARAEGEEESGKDTAPEDSTTPQAPAAAPPGPPKPPVSPPAPPALPIPIKPPMPPMPGRRDSGSAAGLGNLLSPVLNTPRNTPVP